MVHRNWGRTTIKDGKRYRTKDIYTYTPGADRPWTWQRYTEDDDSLTDEEWNSGWKKAEKGGKEEKPIDGNLVPDPNNHQGPKVPPNDHDAEPWKYGSIGMAVYECTPDCCALRFACGMQADRAGEPQDLDPAWAYDTLSSELLTNVYDSLLKFNRTNVDTYIPGLAPSWNFTPIYEMSPEGFQWVQRLTFKIREDVFFQYYDGSIPGEGALLTPQDVEYTFERLLVTDAATGPSWMVWEPLFMAGWAGDLDAMLTDLGWPINVTTGWNTMLDEAIDHAIESNATTVWFNLVMPYEPILQILSQSLGSIVNQAWCVWHGDWPGMSAGDDWYLWHDPVTSPLYSSSPAAPGPHLDCALGTGPYMLEYWNKGAGGAWSIIRNPDYWEGWTITAHVGWGPSEPAIVSHVTRYTSNYIPEWTTRKLRFLGGLTDFCDVPRNYIDQVLGQPGIRCVSSLPQLACYACFFNFAVSTSSTHMGVMQAPGTFSQYGAPPNIMEDLDFRRALTHMFDYATYLQDAFLNEAVSPVTPIIPELPYYDPAIGQKEDPSIAQNKKYGIAGEPAGQLAYDLNLAVTYLQAAWGGQLWAQGFTFDAVYSAGGIAGPTEALLIKDAFDAINAQYGTMFTINLVSMPLSVFVSEWKARKLPYFDGGWIADFPDPYDFVFPFMSSYGDFSEYQGYSGVTSFPNAEVDSHIDAAIATTVPSERQGNYTWLQQYYVDNAPGFVLSQPTGRHWERDWVQGWYYNPAYPGNYVYDLWKDTGHAHDIGITNVASSKTVVGQGCPVSFNVTVENEGDCTETFHVHVYYGDAVMITPEKWDTFWSMGDVNRDGYINQTDLDRIGDMNGWVGPPGGIPEDINSDGVVNTYDIGICSNNQGLSIWTYFALSIPPIGTQIVTLANQTSTTLTFPWTPQPGKYSIRVEVDPVPSETDTLDNHCLGSSITVTIPGDVTGEGSCDMQDISIMIDWFMTGPPTWDPNCDINDDLTIDMADISLAIENFMESEPQLPFFFSLQA